MTLYLQRNKQYHKVWNNKKAFIKTCEYRKFFMSKKDAFVLLREIESNRQMQKRWANYCGNVGYAEGIDFTQAIGAIKEWLEVVL